MTAAVSPKSDGTSPSLRVQSIMTNDAARKIGCKVRKHMRVPQTSAISRAFGDMAARRYCGVEDQSDWEVSGQGTLTALRWEIDAVRRGPLAYGLLTNMALYSAFVGLQKSSQRDKAILESRLSRKL
jgi:hypothetical protein